MRILIVEDEQRLADTLADVVTGQSNSADVSYDGDTGLDNALTGIYDAIILDVMLPGRSGFELLRELRAGGVHTPVLMLTARTDLGDRVRGLDLGADYYLGKPFETEELLACLRAIVRRRGDQLGEELTYGDLTLSLAGAELRCGERAVQLRAKELELMRLLMENRELYLAKETILLKVWGYDTEAEGNVVEVYMSFLRKKLQHIRSAVRITAARLVGYHLEGGHD